tara:strand:+ start:403 stop:663 length:261 start_codon:yes stop_codon:yes gene_type:complete
MTVSYSKAVFAINGNAQFTIYDDDLDNIVWHDGNPTNITKEQIIAKDTELKTVEDAKPENVLKASAKAKLISGEALTEDEANTIVI